jgi:4-hydroxy-4-methyl-2-oxoglutarate aldolase
VARDNDSQERTNDLRLVERLGALHPAVVADCLDRLGCRNQVLDPRIRPLFPTARIAGIAFTVRCVPIDGVPENTDDHYKGELQAVDALEEGDVMVVSTCKGSYWGELLATAARYRGARGIVADAYARDTIALIDMEFPTFVAGISAYDSLGRIDVDGINVPIECGCVTVEAGDFVLADYDGVVIVPRGVAEDTIRAAEEKVAGENMVREKLAGGMRVWDAFRAYGII